MEGLGIGQTVYSLSHRWQWENCPIFSQVSYFLMNSDYFLYLSLVNDFRELPQDTHLAAQCFALNDKSSHRSTLMCCRKGSGLVGDLHREKSFLKMWFFYKKIFLTMLSPLFKYLRGKDYSLFLSIQNLLCVKGVFLINVCRIHFDT